MRHRAPGVATVIAGLLAVAAVAGVAGCGSGSTHHSAPAAPGPLAGPTTTTTGPASTGTALAGSIVGVPTRVAATTDGDVGYRVDGQGPPLVLIMGFAGTMDAWDPAFVDELARSHRVVVFDNAGVGRTSPRPSPLTVTAMADQTAALIEALHLGPTAVLGWSMGGLIAQALAVTHPALVTELVLCAALPGNGHATLPSRAVSADLTRAAQNPAALLALLFPVGQAAAERTYLTGILSYADFYTPSAAVEAQQGQALESWTSGKEPAGSGIARLRVPVLVADGTEDVLAPEVNARTLAATIPGAQLALYPGAGHAFLFQDRTTFVSRMEAFLTSSRSSTTPR